jgi:4-hydroxy-tetrahydrodipicolinate synthase
MPTPFKKNGELDETGLRDLVMYIEGAGVNGIFALGTIGEFAMMGEQERRKAAEIIVGASNRLEVIVNAGCASTRETVREALFLKDLGVDAIVAVVPYFYHPSPAGMAGHYLAIAEEADMPVIAYNVPQFSGNCITPDIMDTIVEDVRIVGLKDSEGDALKLAEFIARAPRDFSVMVGADTLAAYGVCMGARGMILGSAMLAPDVCVEMYRAALDGDIRKAVLLQKRLNGYVKAMGVGSFPAAFKYILSTMGLPGGHVRSPLEDLSDREKRIVDGYIRDAKAMKEMVM